MWSVVYCEPNNRFTARGGFESEGAAVMALVYETCLQSKPIVVETWKAAALVALLNAKEPPT